jgi:hypothetical protein
MKALGTDELWTVNSVLKFHSDFICDIMKCPKMLKLNNEDTLRREFIYFILFLLCVLNLQLPQSSKFSKTLEQTPSFWKRAALLLVFYVC